MITLTSNGEQRVQKYVGLLSQAGTANPAATILWNSAGAIVWTRTGVGVYEGVPADWTPEENNTIIFTQLVAGTPLAFIYAKVNLGKIILNCYNTSAADDLDGLLYIDITHSNPLK